MTVTGFPGSELLSRERRAELLKVFAIPKRRRQSCCAGISTRRKKNVYRGWFPLQRGGASYKEGIDIGPDLVPGAAPARDGDPLCEATPLPPKACAGLARGGSSNITRPWKGRRRLMRSWPAALASTRRSSSAFQDGISTLQADPLSVARGRRRRGRTFRLVDHKG